MKAKLTSDMAVFDDIKSAQVLYDLRYVKREPVEVTGKHYNTILEIVDAHVALGDKVATRAATRAAFMLRYDICDLINIIQAVELFDEVELDNDDVSAIVRAIRADNFITDFLNSKGVEVV